MIRCKPASISKCRNLRRRWMPCAMLLVLFVALTPTVAAQNGLLVLQTDFGESDGAVAAMKGVAAGVSRDLKIFDLTHDIPPYNIWEAAYRLNQTASYWPEGTVFVSVVDPGVGSARKSVVMKSKSGHFFVTPDNGTLTLVAATLGLSAVREIDESRNRLRNSNDSYTFHGRDVYAFTGARLASGAIRFEEVGDNALPDVVRLPFQEAILEGKTIRGTIDILDVRYGNVWTNIPERLLRDAGIAYGDHVKVSIFEGKRKMFEGKIIFGRTFSAVKEGEPVAYLNSLMNFSVAINMGSFAAKHKIVSGPGWTIQVSK